MENRNSWEIDQLRKSDDKHDARLDDHEARLRELETFRSSTVEKLIRIFEMLDELREGDRWIKRTIAGTLITTLVGAIVAAITWFIQH